MDFVVRKVALDIFRGVVLRSPVDTGSFRGAWMPTTKGLVISYGTIPELGKTSASTITAVVVSVQRMKAGETALIFTSMPYGRRLEYGWSQQALRGWSG